MRLTDNPVVVLYEDAAERIAKSTSEWGLHRYVLDEVNGIVGVVGAADKSGTMISTSRELLRGHSLGQVQDRADGWWYRAPKGLHAAHRWMLRVRGALPLDTFRAQFPSWRVTSREATAVVLTRELDADQPWAAWAVAYDGVAPLAITLLRAPHADPTAGLAPDWPVDVLAESRFTVVGIGSIGAVVAGALAASGVGRLALVDDDRLLWHNLTRHVASRRDVGRYKVDVVKDSLSERWPGTSTDALRLNVISDADQIRPLLDTTDVVVCATDGVAPRRVVSHLARRSGITAVLACVLLDGAVGEVLRLRPWPGHGCLLCQRHDLVQQGVLDPEPAIERPYGTGDRHLPMTALGPDLHMVGQLAAKVAVATHLEGKGFHDQTIRGESAIIGLRPDGNTADYGPLFDVTAGTINWCAASPTQPGCPTCAPRPL